MAQKWNVDKYMSPHEPKHHWDLRRKFMVENMGRFPENRLVCLGQTFANIEFLGCRYPKDTMELVEDMAFGIVQNYREEQKNRLKRTFVSGSDAAGAKVNRGARGVSQSLRPPPTKRPREGSSISDGPEALNSSTSRLGGSEHLSRIPGAGISESLKARLGNSPKDLVSSDGRGGKRNRGNQDHVRGGQAWTPSNFVLVRLEYESDENPINVLTRSAGFCKVSVGWDLVPTPSGFTCRVKINDHVVKVASDVATKKEAKLEATAMALSDLERSCYTIVVKNKYQSDGTTVDALTLESKDDRGEVVKRSGSDSAIDQGNIGHKLLKMMGWSGGGLGKGGQGISEPVTAASVTDRQGLGADRADSEFKKKIEKLIKEYIGSSNPYDLVFTPDFGNEQRAVIHSIARRLGLRSKSHGKEDDRFITISRKFDARQLIQELIRLGGSSEKYQLLPPKCT